MAVREKQQSVLNGQIPTPKQIMAYLDERVIGQESAKKRLAVAVYNHYKRVAANVLGIGNTGKYQDIEIDKSNVIMLGNTGTGKTFLIQNIAKMLGVPYYIQDCTKLTESGYVGDDVENCITGLLRACDYDVEKAEIGIICLDEIDKLAKKGENVSITRDVSGEGVQQGLLKIVEGNVVGVMPNGGRKHPDQELIQVDTTNILFIGMGAFCGIEKIINQRISSSHSAIGFSGNWMSDAKDCNSVDDFQVLDNVNAVDLRRFGLIPEFIGRFPVITHTNPLTRDDLRTIITSPKNSILKQYEKMFYLDGKELILEDGVIDIIAETAILTETGARGIRSIMETILNELMFESIDSKKKKIKVSKEYAENALKCMLKNVKKTA